MPGSCCGVWYMSTYQSWRVSGTMTFPVFEIRPMPSNSWIGNCVWSNPSPLNKHICMVMMVNYLWTQQEDFVVRYGIVMCVFIVFITVCYMVMCQHVGHVLAWSCHVLCLDGATLCWLQLCPLATTLSSPLICINSAQYSTNIIFWGWFLALGILLYRIFRWSMCTTSLCSSRMSPIF